MPAVDIILQGQEMASPVIEAVRGSLEGLKGEAEETGESSATSVEFYRAASRSVWVWQRQGSQRQGAQRALPLRRGNRSRRRTMN